MKGKKLVSLLLTGVVAGSITTRKQLIIVNGCFYSTNGQFA
ncbi:hypothetical protein [Paenibacillus sp. LK1]|nr:hypothetical protein [Paenibacillus sp. LK1]